MLDTIKNETDEQKGLLGKKQPLRQKLLRKKPLRKKLKPRAILPPRN